MDSQSSTGATKHDHQPDHVVMLHLVAETVYSGGARVVWADVGLLHGPDVGLLHGPLPPPLCHALEEGSPKAACDTTVRSCKSGCDVQVGDSLQTQRAVAAACSQPGSDMLLGQRVRFHLLAGGEVAVMVPAGLPLVVATAGRAAAPPTPCQYLLTAYIGATLSGFRDASLGVRAGPPLLPIVLNMLRKTGQTHL